jgi:acyl carrier protein
MSAMGPDLRLEEHPEETLDVVAQLIREVIAEEWIWEASIGLETSFSDDLMFQSIEVITLAEKLDERYGEGLNFIGWISEMEVEEIMSLRVGALVDYIDSSRL